MITFRQKGDFSKITRYLNKVEKAAKLDILSKYGQQGINALASATPVETGLTANSWYFEVSNQNGSATISYFNSHVNKGVCIAIILQYGHGTGTGGWVEGRDYINPAIQPVFDKIVEDAWKEVTSI